MYLVICMIDKEKKIIIIENKLNQLSKSKFRNSFKIKEKDINYIKKRGIREIKNDFYKFIQERLSSINIKNDEHQTPMKGHPVFIAQHATAICCRGCLEKWHKIPKNRELTNSEKNYVVSLIVMWIIKEMQKSEKK